MYSDMYELKSLWFKSLYCNTLCNTMESKIFIFCSKIALKSEPQNRDLNNTKHIVIYTKLVLCIKFQDNEAIQFTFNNKNIIRCY